jgi:hypothetical protein
MYCPMQLDCKVMTGVIHNCPNLSECLRNSPLRRVEALRLYFQNLGVQPDSAQNSLYIDVCSSQPLTSGYTTTFTYNRDSQSRDRILFGIEIDWEQQPGGIKQFEGLALDQLEQLVEGGFVNLQDRHNFAPSIAAFREFARQWTRCGLRIAFEGYAVHPLRDDYRVSIDGITFQEDDSGEAIAAFREFARHADELTLESGYLRAWWD